MTLYKQPYKQSINNTLFHKILWDFKTSRLGAKEKKQWQKLCRWTLQHFYC